MRAGVDPTEIATRAGHAGVACTYDRYGYLLPDVEKPGATKLEGVLRPGSRDVVGPEGGTESDG